MHATGMQVALCCGATFCSLMQLIAGSSQRRNYCLKTSRIGVFVTASEGSHARCLVWGKTGDHLELKWVLSHSIVLHSGPQQTALCRPPDRSILTSDDHHNVYYLNAYTRVAQNYV